MSFRRKATPGSEIADDRRRAALFALLEPVRVVDCRLFWAAHVVDGAAPGPLGSALRKRSRCATSTPEALGPPMNLWAK